MPIKQNENIRGFLLYCLLVVVSIGCTCRVTPLHTNDNGLFPKGKLLGQPYMHARPDIRMVRVCSVDEADSFYYHLCGNNEILKYRMDSKDVFYCKNKSTGGTMIYSHHVPPGTYEVGIIHFLDTVINRLGITEVHFVKAIRIE